METRIRTEGKAEKKKKKQTEKKERKEGDPVAQWLMNPTNIHEDSGWIPGLGQCIKNPVLS